MPTNNPKEEEIDELVRDLTKAHPMPKSEARRRIQELLDQRTEEIQKDVYNKFDTDKDSRKKLDLIFSKYLGKIKE